MEPRRSGSVRLRMEMPVSIQRASETSRAREIDLAHAGFWFLGVVCPPRAGACAPTTLEPKVESGQTVEGGPRRCTLRTETTSPFGSCRSAWKPISVQKFPTFLMNLSTIPTISQPNYSHCCPSYITLQTFIHTSTSPSTYLVSLPLSPTRLYPLGPLFCAVGTSLIWYGEMPGLARGLLAGSAQRFSVLLWIALGA